MTGGEMYGSGSMKQNATATPETHTSRRLRIALLVSAATFGLQFCMLLTIFRFSGPPDWFQFTFFGSVLCTFVTGLARFGYVLFAELQTPLSEWLITFVFSGVVMSVLSKVYSEEFLRYRSAGAAVLVLVCVAVILGSIWGWGAAKRMKETRTPRRVGLLALGWMLVPGVSGAAICILISAILLAYGLPDVSAIWRFYLWSGLSSLLMIPALYCEIYIRSLPAGSRDAEWKAPEQQKMTQQDSGAPPAEDGASSDNG